MTVTACVMVAPVWLLWVTVYCLQQTGHFLYFSQTHFFLAFWFFMGLETVWTVEITLTVLAVSGTLFSRFKIGATALIFLGTCSLAAGTTVTHIRMMSSVLCIVPLTAVRAEVGPVEECNHTSQAIEVIPMFDQVNDFIVLIHVTFEKDGTGDVIDHNDCATFGSKKRLKLFSSSYPHGPSDNRACMGLPLRRLSYCF